MRSDRNSQSQIKVRSGRGLIAGTGGFLFLAMTLMLMATAAIAQPASVALVESINNAPDSGVEELDYVEDGQQINLGSGGVLVLTYFAGCLEETITGGTVTVKAGGAGTAGGVIQQKVLDCQQSDIALGDDSGEAGAAVSRVNTSLNLDWSEQTILVDRPWFKLPKGSTAAEIRVFDADEDPAALLWSAAMAGSAVQYPADAPALEIGWPYRVEMIAGDRVVAAADFSFDPELEVPMNALARTVLAQQTP